MSIDKLITHDETVSQQIAPYAHRPVFLIIAWFVARTGDCIFWLLLSLLLIWLRWPLGWPLLITIVVTGILTAAAKGIFKRERPIAKWAIATDIYSFPSGHSARAGALALFFAFAFPQWAILFALWAVLVAIARVMLSRHYVIDVAGGLLFGFLVSLMLQYLLR